MGKKTGTGKGTGWFFYRTRRKVRFLLYRGTFFHSTPREERLKRNRSMRLKHRRLRSRKLRHFFFLFRPATVKRYNRILKAEIKAYQAKISGFQTLSGKPAPESPVQTRNKKYSFHDRIYRPGRKVKYLLKQAERRRAAKAARKKAKSTLRKIRYLYRTGKLFRINFRPFLDSIHRNLSFLGKSKFLIILINSTFIFILSYFFVFFVKELAISIAAGTVNIKAVMMYYDVEFLIRSRDWTPDMVKVVYSTGPLITGLLAIFSLIIFGLTLHERWMIRLFILWVGYHAIAQSLGDVIFGTILNQGFGWVLAYLYYTDTDNMLFVTGLLFVMMLVGILLSRFLLLSANIYFNNLSSQNRRPFLMSQVLLPFLIATAIIILIKQPMRNNFDFVVEGSMLIFILPGLIRARYTNDLFFDEEPRKFSLQWIWIFTAIAVLVLFRTFFWIGVRI
jgi:hypothetical protein